jgi:hypothetical protein
MSQRNTPTLDAISAPNAHKYHAEVMERARMMEEAIRDALADIETMKVWPSAVVEAVEKLKGAL